MPRFVVLRHETPPDSARATHFDFMLEDAGRLLTWSLPAPPLAGRSMAATPLPEHRLEYLDYEGAIAGNRGTVTRWDAGEFAWLDRRDDYIRVRLLGNKFTGIATLATMQLRDPQRDPPLAVAWTHFATIEER